MNPCQQRYMPILNKLNLEYKNNHGSAKDLTIILKTLIEASAKLKVIQDCDIIPAMTEYLQTSKKDRAYTDLYNKDVKFIQKLADELLTSRYIIKKHHAKITNSIEKEHETSWPFLIV